MTIDKNDHRLIDYAIGELVGQGRLAFELELEKDPEAQAAVAELQDAAGLARETMEPSAELALTGEQRAEVLRGAKTSADRKPVKQTSAMPALLAIAAVCTIVIGAILMPSLARAPREAARRASPDQLARQAVIEAEMEAAEGQRTGSSMQNVYVGGELRARGVQVANAPEANVPNWPGMPPPPPPTLPQLEPSNTESYDRVTDNEFKTVVDNPLSTFSIDVDTASYANIRRFLTQGQMPPKDAVRIEEMVNYFDYAYEPPTGEHPFAVHVEVAACPWQPAHRLARIGLQGQVLEEGERPPTNLVFLIDVSGSMNQRNKLPLLVESMKLLARQMRPVDTVALAVYAGSSGLVLPPTSGGFQQSIIDALNRLRAGGSTNGGAGIQLAYDVATQAFIDGGVNRVILATDGDFNVGTTDAGSLTRLIEEKAKSGVFLSVLGFGMGNLKDATMEQLADKGNGNYAYIDTLKEARKVLVEQAAGTLVTIAKDVKIQVDFNPANVQAYRLIGYENRMLAAEDFEDDTKDAGEIGAGHRVTALYELVPPGVEMEKMASVTPSAYQDTPQLKNARPEELMQVRLRYKQPDGDTSIPFVVPVTQPMAGVPIITPFETASQDFQFAASVAAFGMLLRESPYRGAASYDFVLAAAQRGLGEDANGYRAEYVQLVQTAKSMRGQTLSQAEAELRAAEEAYRRAQERMRGLSSTGSR